MRRREITIVAFFFTALIYSSHVYCLDTDDFSEKLRRVAENILRIDEFQNYLKPHVNKNLKFLVSDPNGMDHVQWIASEISRNVRDRAMGVINLWKAVKESFKKTMTQEDVMPKCCPTENLNLQQDLRFPVKANVHTGCLFGKQPKTTNEGKTELKGISKELVSAMSNNLRIIPGVKWQYFGNKDGVMFSYPAKGSCHRSTYDPRLRPWYSFAATNPKDIIVMIDKSSSMLESYLTSADKKLTVAIKAAQTAIDSLNPNDNVGVLAFDDKVHLPKLSDGCYSHQLALATKENKEILENFVNSLPSDSTSDAVYSAAFKSAFELFTATSNSSESTTRKKVILLLANGDPKDSFTNITQSIIDGNQLVGTKVTILSYGMDTNIEEGKVLYNISKLTGGQFKKLDDPDLEMIKTRIAQYYNYFPKLNDNNDVNDVVFTVPYNDSGGLGMVTSACLPVVAEAEFQGVTCMDIPIDTMFSPIIDFHLGRLSYAFLIDSQGRVLLHPLLPKPESYKHQPIFLDMESVEISEATMSIKASMISGSTGSMTVSDLRLFSSRGYSLHDGVTHYVGKATYYWSPILVMNASVGLVIVEVEKNVSASWTGDYPQVLLTEEIHIDDTNDKCNNFGRIASKESSVVKLSPQCFVEPYNYTQQVITTEMLQQFKDYLRDRTTETSFTVKPGVRESIALTYELERLWKLSAAATSDKSAHVAKVSDYALKRYVGTREGVYRVYPAVRVATKFDPTKRPWYRRAEAQRTPITLTTQKDNNGYVITSLAKAFTDTGANDILGVVGADVPASLIYNFLMTEFDPCRHANRECFAIDRSGFVLTHHDFLKNPSSEQSHITTKEPKVAADMIKRGIMKLDSCVNYADITNQHFYLVELRGGDRELTNGYIYEISGFDMHVVVTYQHSSGETGTCSCPLPSGGDPDRRRCDLGSQCQCPCYTPTDYSYCTGQFTTNNTKTCYPSTLPIYLVDLSVDERSVVKSLPACLHCSMIADKKLCSATGCSWKSGNCSISYDKGTESPACDNLCIGLAVGFTIGLVVVVAIIVLVVLAWRSGRLRCPRLPTVSETSTDTPDTSPHKTVIYVSPEAAAAEPHYYRIDGPGSSASPPSPEDQYLHVGHPDVFGKPEVFISPH